MAAHSVVRYQSQPVYPKHGMDLVLLASVIPAFFTRTHARSVRNQVVGNSTVPATIQGHNFTNENEAITISSNLCIYGTVKA